MAKRILILDDDYSNAEALAMIIEQEGFSVKHTQMPKMIFPLIKNFDPHLLFLDIQLGNDDGRLI